MPKKSSKKKTVPRLLAAFDTSVLFTDQAHNLLRREASKLIRNNSDHVDLKIEWYLSDVVTGERRYQMQKKASQLYKKVEQLEHLLGHQFTTEDIVGDRIRGAIVEQCASLGINVVSLDPDNVDWVEIQNRSVNRKPPFDPNVREKGFRDAVIAETFVQLVDKSPRTAASCRLAFVSGDELMRTYIQERVGDRSNVRIFESLNELEGLINTLVSKVPEEKISEWQGKAQKYFFIKGDKSTYFYKEDLRKTLSEKYAEQLAETPEVGCIRQGGTWYIERPVFIRKDRQRLHWMTQITAESTLYRLADPSSGTGGFLAAASKSKGVFDPSFLVSGGILPPAREEVGSAQSFIEVEWSVSVSAQRETLSKPRVDKTRFIDTEVLHGKHLGQK